MAIRDYSRLSMRTILLSLLCSLLLSGCGGGQDTPKKPQDSILVVSEEFVKTYGDAPFFPTVTAKNDGDLSYNSNDTAVATVTSDGLVTLQGAGSATITVTEAESTHFLSQSSSITLTAARGAGAPLSIVPAISKSYGNGAFTPAVTGGNGGSLSYSSDDTDVATVLSNGLITLQGTGNTMITVTEDEITDFLGQSAIITLTFTKPPQIEHIVSTDSAFAALRANGSVMTWGGSGGDSSGVAS